MVTFLNAWINYGFSSQSLYSTKSQTFYRKIGSIVKLKNHERVWHETIRNIPILLDLNSTIIDYALCPYWDRKNYINII